LIAATADPTARSGHGFPGAIPAGIVASVAAKYAGWDITDHRTDGPRVLLGVPVACCLLTDTAR
jgi:hypothetical protein